MADEEKVVDEKKSKVPKVPKVSKEKLSLVMVAVLIIVGIVLAGAISFFVAAKIAGDKTVTVITKREPGMLMHVGDPKDGVIVNIGGVTGRYLKIVMTVEIEPTKSEKGDVSVTPQDEIKINDTVIQFLRAQKIDAFSPDKQGELKENIKAAINESLGSDRVMAVFVTNLVIQ